MPVVTAKRICCKDAVAMRQEPDGVVVCSECLNPVDLLPGAVVDQGWRKGRDGTDEPIPREWEAGLWGLDAAVRAAVRGGWTDEEVQHEVRQLLESHRQPPTE